MSIVITNNGGGGYCVGSEAAGVLLLALKPGDNEVEKAAWDKCKDRPAIKAALKSGRLVVGGNLGAPPSKAHITQHENMQRKKGKASGEIKTPTDHLAEMAAKEKADFAKYPTMGMPESKALKFIAECKDPAILEACYEACDTGKDARLAVKAAIEKRAVEMAGEPEPEPEPIESEPEDNDEFDGDGNESDST